MLKVVFDTSILISAFITPFGKAEEAFLLAIRKEIELYTSLEILTETANKLRTKFSYPDADVVVVLTLLKENAAIVKPKEKLSILADEPDNRILECAVYIKADYIVTGDKHLLKLHECEQIKIVRLKDFLALVGGAA